MKKILASRCKWDYDANTWCIIHEHTWKNNFAIGPIGEHVVEFTFLTPSGELIKCTKESNKELFYTFISGLGNAWLFL